MSTTTANLDDRHVWINLAKVIGALCGVAIGLIVIVSFIA